MKKLKTIFITSLIILSFVTISVIADIPETPENTNSEEDDCADCDPAPSSGTPESKLSSVFDRIVQ